MVEEELTFDEEYLSAVKSYITEYGGKLEEMLQEYYAALVQTQVKAVSYGTAADKLGSFVESVSLLKNQLTPNFAEPAAGLIDRFEDDIVSTEATYSF